MARRSDAPVRRATQRVQVTVVEPGGVRQRPDQLATEEPMEIRLHGPGETPVPVAVTTLARIFSFASLEIWRFIATDDGKRLMVLLRHLWIVPLAVLLFVSRPLQLVNALVGVLTLRVIHQPIGLSGQ